MHFKILWNNRKRSLAIGKVCVGLTINTEETAEDDLKVKERNDSREKISTVLNVQSSLSKIRLVILYSLVWSNTSLETFRTVILLGLGADGILLWVEKWILHYSADIASIEYLIKFLWRNTEREFGG